MDVLVNVAGIAEESTNFQMTSLEKMKRVMEANSFSATIISQYVSRLMVRQQYGTIVNITSIAGLDGEPAQYEYASSKAALIGATKNLARELAPYNIRVNAVAPGMIETKMGGNPTINKETISEKLLIGKDENVKVIPALGYVFGILKSRIGYLCIVVLPILVGFVYELFVVGKELKNKK